MRHLFMAAVMVVGALLITATTAGVLQSRAISGSKVGTYEPPSMPAPTSRIAKSTNKAPEPAVIGVRARPTVTPRDKATTLGQRI